MAETGERAAHFLLARLEGLARPHVALRPLPFLIPLQTQSTMLEPAQSIYAQLAKLDGGSYRHAVLHAGIPSRGFSGVRTRRDRVWAIGRRGSARGRSACAQIDRSAGERVRHAGVYARRRRTPRNRDRTQRARARSCIADTQDNPGAGGNSDTTGMLRALVGANAQRAAIGLMVDPEAALAAHARRSKAAPSRSGSAASPTSPAMRRSTRASRSSSSREGRFTCTGPFYRGVRMNLGPSRVPARSAACASWSRPTNRRWPIRRCIASSASSPHAKRFWSTRARCTSAPTSRPIAEEILVCKAPGPMLADPSDFPWKNLAPGIRLKPNGARFTRS